MFRLIIPSLDYNYEKPSHQWTSYHDAVVNHHLKLGEMPHADTHTKAQTMDWATNIGDFVQEVSVSYLVASLTCFMLHHQVNSQEAKQLALELSHHCQSVSTFSNLIGSFWDKYVAHKSREVNPTVNAGRLAASTLRASVRKQQK